MLEATIVYGIVILVGFGLLIAKLPRRMVLWMLGHHFALDLSVTLVALWIHWGTMTGLMAAAMAGMMCSVVTTTARKLIGYREGKRVVRGVLT